MRRILVAGVVGLSLLVSGCSTGSSSSSGSPAVGAPVDSGMVSVPGTTNLDQSQAGSSAKDAGGAVTSRSVVKNASVSVAVEHPLDVAPQLVTIATDAGGYVQDSSSSPAGQYQGENAQATLRIPADALASVQAKVLALGAYVSSSENATDVTLQVTDVNARIASLTTSIARLTSLMAGATSTADLLAAESALAQRQADLDSLVAQREYLANQVDLATVSVSLVQRSSTAATSQNFWDGLAQGWNSVVNVGSVLVVALGFMLPWLAILGGLALIAALIVWIIVRATRSRHAVTPRSESPDSSQN